MPRIKPFLVPFLLFAAVAPALIYYSLHRGYPVADGADYLTPALKTYSSWRSYGLSSFLTSVYLDRSWKPVAFPMVSLPFLFATGGNVLWSVALCVVFLRCCLVAQDLDKDALRTSCENDALVVGPLEGMDHSRWETGTRTAMRLIQAEQQGELRRLGFGTQQILTEPSRVPRDVHYWPLPSRRDARPECAPFVAR